MKKIWVIVLLLIAFNQALACICRPIDKFIEKIKNHGASHFVHVSMPLQLSVGCENKTKSIEALAKEYLTAGIKAKIIYSDTLSFEVSNGKTFTQTYVIVNTKTYYVSFISNKKELIDMSSSFIKQVQASFCQ